MAPSRKMVARLVFGLVPIAWLVVHASFYEGFVVDDAFISLRYAERLATGHGLTWTEGPRVEGYSNLAWVLACAGGGRVLGDYLLAARGLGLLCSAAAILAVVTSAWRSGGGRFEGAGLVAGCLLASCGSFVAWSRAGLETPLFVACLAGASVLLMPAFEDDVRTDVRSTKRSVHGRLWASSALYAGLCLTRPDGPLFVAIAAFGLVLHHRGRAIGWRRAAVVVGLPLVAVLAQLGFRWVYYEDWVPNTARIKAYVNDDRIVSGAVYVARAVPHLLVLVGFGLLGGLAASRGHRRAFVIMLASSAVAWTAYIVAVGGDVFPAYRHAQPVIVLAALSAGIGLEWWASNPLARRRAWLAAMGIAALVVQPGLELVDRHLQRARAGRWEWSAMGVGRVYGRGFASVSPAPLIAMEAAGSVAFHAKLPALDMLGLNDRQIARADRGRGRVGHDHFDLDYVLGREPDLILFAGYGRRSGERVTRALFDDPRFDANYQLTYFAGDWPHAFYSHGYVREHGRLGVREVRDRRTIPAYLLEGSKARLGGVPGPGGDPMQTDVRMVAGLDPGKPVGYTLELAAGRHRLHREPNNPLVRVQVWSERGLRGCQDSGEFELDTAQRVNVVAMSSVMTSDLRALTIEGVAVHDGPPCEQFGQRLGDGRIALALHREGSVETEAADVELTLEALGSPLTPREYVGTAPAPQLAPAVAATQSFEVDEGMMLSFELQGPERSQWQALYLLVDGYPVRSWGGAAQGDWSRISVDLSPYAGHRARLVHRRAPGFPAVLELRGLRLGRWQFRP